MSALSKIQAATPTGGGTNIRDGRYLYFIERVVYNEKGHNGPAYIVEFRVVESEANGDVDEKGAPTIPNAVGSSCSMVCLLDKHESAGGNAKACVLGALAPLGYVEAQITEPLLLDLASAANPLRGIAIRNETRRGWNKGRAVAANAGKPLTLNSWKSVAQTAENIMAQRAWLDANASQVEIPVRPATIAQATAPVVQAAVTPAPAVVAQPVAVAAPQPAPAPVATGGASALLAQLGLKV